MLLTVGHGAAAEDDFAALLRAAGVELVVDVRLAPASRRHPHFGAAAMTTWLPAAGVDYRSDRRLGGFRRQRPGTPHLALAEPAMRGYADHMEGAEFRAALADLLADTRARRTAALCSERDPARCHRRLLADAAVLLHGCDVAHLDHAGALEPHRPSPAARVDGDRLVYDAGVAAPLFGA